MEDLIVDISEPSSLSSNGEILSMSSLEGSNSRLRRTMDIFDFLTPGMTDTC